MRKTLRGIIPVIPTPLHEDETLDAPALKRIIEYGIEGGVHGVWILGSGGELPNLSPEQRTSAIETAVETVGGRVPVVVGVGRPGTRMISERCWSLPWLRISRVRSAIRKRPLKPSAATGRMSSGARPRCCAGAVTA